MVNGIFSKFERDELNKITAKSILEKLMNIRQNINVEFTARRLVWELMQNAKDNASLCNEEGEKVDVSLELTKNQFIFSHNKGYFTNEHIRGLIRKYSSSDKERDSQQIGRIYKTTGRFGTGFMTTHLLSEKVQVESYYKNDDNLFSKFYFWLDRSGKGEKEIVQGINNSFDEAEISIQKSPNIPLTRDRFKTSFTYPLAESKRKLAHIAITEVQSGIAYTLINVPEINSVTIIEDLIGETIYKINPINTILAQDKELLIYNLEINGKNSKYNYLVLKETELNIIIPILYTDENYSTLELDLTIPRLHLDFPMIGTEDLNLPFVVNSSLFEPTEPRDGISLIDDDENEISKMNCNIILRAVELYKYFLSYVGGNENWSNLYNLARIKSPKKHSWIDVDWFKQNVINPIRYKILHTPLVEVVNGERISIWDEDEENQVYFPYAEKEDIREMIWELSKKIFPKFIPIREQIAPWSEIIWKDCYKFSMYELSEEIHNKENLECFAEFFESDTNKAIDFLNEYYEVLNVEANHIKDILSDKYNVIPNQLGEFKKKSALYIDKNIDEELKNACVLVKKDPREYLVHKNVDTGDNITYSIKEQEDIITILNNIIKEGKDNNISIVCDYLASLFPKKNVPQKRLTIFDFSQQVYPEDFVHKRRLIYYDERIWEESDKKSISYIVSAIAKHKEVKEAYGELGFEDKDAFIEWLNELISFLVKEGFEYYINREREPILPNQNGVFCTKEHLFLDDGSIDEELKDICKELGYDFRKELLDIAIFLELPENRLYTIKEVAEKISSFIKPILKDIDKRKEYKETLKEFYLWMDENKQKSERYFSDLFEKRFLFLEDDDISQNMKKASELDQLMEEHGIDTIEDLRIQLSNIQNQKKNDSENDKREKVDITKEILVSLGISSLEELEEALKDPAISAKFYHTSTPTVDMFIYAQGLIERAKQNIIKYLEQQPEYDCKEIEETAHTTLAGILKNGLPIQIVARPSDNGEVIIYYSSEKDTLDSDNAELWVDNGVDDPHILTLGRVLKSTGINKILINMN